MPVTMGADRRSSSADRAPPRDSRLATFGRSLSGLAEMGLGAGFLVTWYDPEILGHTWVKLALEVMLLEFVLIHSGPFLGMTWLKFPGRRKRWLATVGLALMYSVAVLGFCLGLKTWRPMLSFWIVTSQRLAGNVLDPRPTEEAKAQFMGEVALSAVLYLMLVAVTTVLPVPALGIHGPLADVDSGGLWIDEPQKVVALAGFYYLIRGYFTANARPGAAGNGNPRKS